MCPLPLVVWLLPVVIRIDAYKNLKIVIDLLIFMNLCRSAHTPPPMSKEELSSTVSIQLFNGETQSLTISLENIGSEDIETLELTSKILTTKGQFASPKVRAAVVLRYQWDSGTPMKSVFLCICVRCWGLRCFRFWRSSRAGLEFCSAVASFSLSSVNVPGWTCDVPQWSLSFHSVSCLCSAPARVILPPHPHPSFHRQSFRLCLCFSSKWKRCCFNNAELSKSCTLISSLTRLQSFVCGLSDIICVFKHQKTWKEFRFIRLSPCWLALHEVTKPLISQKSLSSCFVLFPTEIHPAVPRLDAGAALFAFTFFSRVRLCSDSEVRCS